MIAAAAAVDTDAAGTDEMVARYEDLRRDALAEPGAVPRSHGWALFLRQGMAAWIRAWTECEASAPGQERRAPVRDAVGVPRVLGCEMVKVLADMVLGAGLGREGTTG